MTGIDELFYEIEKVKRRPLSVAVACRLSIPLLTKLEEIKTLNRLGHKFFAVTKKCLKNS